MGAATLLQNINSGSGLRNQTWMLVQTTRHAHHCPKHKRSGASTRWHADHGTFFHCGQRQRMFLLTSPTMVFKHSRPADRKHHVAVAVCYHCLSSLWTGTNHLDSSPGQLFPRPVWGLPTLHGAASITKRNSSLFNCRVPKMKSFVATLQ